MAHEPIRFGPGETRFRVPAADAGQRLDRFLCKLLPRAQRSFLLKLIDRGRVRVDEERAEPGHRLGAGAEVRLPLDREGFAAFRGRPPATAPAPLEVLHEDEAFLFVAKPAGLPVYGARESLVARVRARLKTPGLTCRVAPAHRLDRETSGVMVFGKTAAAQRWLAAAFRERRVEKRYLAEVEGVPPARLELRGRWRREDRPRGPKVRPDPEGREMVTRGRRLRVRGGRALLELAPETGRTHQLRAQLAATGHPIVGDRRYGRGGNELRLHAWRLVVPAPGGGNVGVTAPPPPWARGHLDPPSAPP